MDNDNKMPYADQQVRILRERAQKRAEMEEEHMNRAEHDRTAVIVLEAAAAIIEVHNVTGISLDDWQPVRDFVEMVIGEDIVEQDPDRPNYKHPERGLPNEGGARPRFDDNASGHFADGHPDDA